MKLKYYLRGLGIGIVVAALLMGFTKSGSKESLTDEEIIARATQLGMVESSVLSADLKEDGVKEPEAGTVVPEAETETVKEPATEVKEPEAGTVVPEAETETVKEPTTEEKETGTKTETPTKPATKTQTPTEQKETTTATKPQKESETESQKEPATKTETPTKPATEQKTETEPGRLFITVYGGDGSRAVADRMEQAGMIEDAAAFDEFLCQNGYDKRLTTGEHEIKAGASFKDMAEALVKKQD